MFYLYLSSMYFIIDTREVVEVFCTIHDFCLAVKKYFASHLMPDGLEQRHPTGRRSSLSESKVLTILVLGEMKSYFPKAVSYTHFLELARQALLHAFLLAHSRSSLSERMDTTLTPRSCPFVITGAHPSAQGL